VHGLLEGCIAGMIFLFENCRCHFKEEGGKVIWWRVKIELSRGILVVCYGSS